MKKVLLSVPPARANEGQQWIREDGKIFKYQDRHVGWLKMKTASFVSIDEYEDMEANCVGEIGRITT